MEKKDKKNWSSLPTDQDRPQPMQRQDKEKPAAHGRERGRHDLKWQCGSKLMPKPVATEIKLHWARKEAVVGRHGSWTAENEHCTQVLKIKKKRDERTGREKMREFKRKLTSGTVTSGMDGVRESKSGSKVLLQSQFELSWSQTVFLAQSLHHFLPARRALPGPFMLATFGIIALPTALAPAISSCPCHAPTSLLYNELTVSCDLGVRCKD